MVDDLIVLAELEVFAQIITGEGQCAAGVLFFAASLANLRPGTAPARKLFVVSLIYLTLLFVALGVDTAIRA